MNDLTADPAQVQNRRLHPRTNLFVAASIITERLRAAVRLRNISQAGALVEGGELPGVGDAFCLRRGDLAVRGQVVRRDAKSAGLSFDQPTDPTDWLPTSESGQQRVDRIVHEARDLYPNARPSPAFLAVKKSHAADTVELVRLADMLDTLADALASDPAVVGRYLDKLQVLDMAGQKLRLIAREG